MHHRRMESESGARVFFRGLGVSGRDMELTEAFSVDHVVVVVVVVAVVVE